MEQKRYKLLSKTERLGAMTDTINKDGVIVQSDMKKYEVNIGIASLFVTEEEFKSLQVGAEYNLRLVLA